MESGHAEVLAEIRFINQELNDAIGRALERIDDEELIPMLNGIRDDHDAHMERIDRMFWRQRRTERVGRLPREFTHYVSEQVDGLDVALVLGEIVRVLADIEILLLDRCRDALDRLTWSPEVESALRDQIADEEEHVRRLETRAPSKHQMLVGSGLGFTEGRD